MRKGNRHTDITIVSEPEDGFPYYSALCQCGWSSVKHHREDSAQKEGTWHQIGAIRGREPGDRR